MPQQVGSVDPVLRPLVMVLAIVIWMGIYVILTRLISRPEGRFRLVACGIAGAGFSFNIGWLVQFLIFGPVGYAASERVATEHLTLTLVMKAGAVIACAGLALGAWARVDNRPLLVALIRPPINVGDRALGSRAFIALTLLGWGVGGLASGLPVALGYV
jgi:hypothetical protein